MTKATIKVGDWVKVVGGYDGGEIRRQDEPQMDTVHKVVGVVYTEITNRSHLQLEDDPQRQLWDTNRFVKVDSQYAHISDEELQAEVERRQTVRKVRGIAHIKPGKFFKHCAIDTILYLRTEDGGVMVTRGGVGRSYAVYEFGDALYDVVENVKVEVMP